jgi:hypothetical protein
MTKLCLLVALGGLVLSGCDAFSAAEAVPFSNIEQAGRLRVQVSGTTVIRDRPGWEAFWQQHGGVAPAPAVDFDRQTVLGVFYGGAFHSGCTSEVDVIRSVKLAHGRLEVRVDRLPDLGPCRAIVYPLDVVVVDAPPSQAFDVRFVGRVP